MSDASDRAAALKKLAGLCEPDKTPKLSPDELAEILDNHAIVSTWQPNTVYAYGQGVRPTVSVGYWFKVIKPGTSGTTEPTWRTSFIGEMSLGAKVSDNDIIYQEMGPDLSNAYNVRAAAYEAWQRKCSKSASYTTGGPQLASIHDHCLRMRDSFMEPLVA